MLFFVWIWIVIVLSIFLDLWLSNSFKYTNYNLVKTLLNFKIYIILLYFLLLCCIYDFSAQTFVLWFFLILNFFDTNCSIYNFSALFLIMFMGLKVNWLVVSHLMIFIAMYLNFDTYFRVISIFSGAIKNSIIYLLPRNFNILLCNNSINNLIFFDRSSLNLVNTKNENWWFSKVISLTEVTQTFKRRGLFSSYHSLILIEVGYLPLLSIVLFTLSKLIFQKYLHLKITY